MTKEELKQEAKEYAKPWKNSLAYVSIKDAYLAGAEQREKRITYLEVTNKKISDECHKLVDSLEKKQNENAELEETIKQLQKQILEFTRELHTSNKENAELKEKLKPENCLKSLAKSGFVKFTCENGNEHDQLIKATKLIRSLYNYCCSYGATGKATTEAEQFLSEVEE